MSCAGSVSPGRGNSPGGGSPKRPRQPGRSSRETSCVNHRRPRVPRAGSRRRRGTRVSRPLVVVDADMLRRQRTGDGTYVRNLLRERPSPAAAPPPAPPAPRAAALAVGAVQPRKNQLAALAAAQAAGLPLVVAGPVKDGGLAAELGRHGAGGGGDGAQG